VQGAYVLCRLFHKPEEKPQALKYDEVEHTGLSPTTTKSSPDDTLSDAVQETATSVMPGVNQSEGIKRWLTDKSDNMTPTTLIPVETSSNSYVASDVEDHVPEEFASEVRSRLTLYLIFFFFFFFSPLCVDSHPVHKETFND
jgi:hypothetical protein